VKQANKLKILHITFNMGIGGTEQVINQLVTGMADMEVHSEILCIDGHIGAIGVRLQKSGVPVHVIQRSTGFSMALVSSIRGNIRRGQFDIVHCHQYTPYFYGFLASIGTQAKVVLTEHGRFHPDRYRYKALIINPLMSLMTPAIVAISRSTRKSLARYEFIPPWKIQVIYNGINGLENSLEGVADVRKELCIPSDAFVVGTVSRLDPVKNQPMMVRAFKRLLSKNSNAWLLLVGDGPDRKMLELLVNELGLSERVIFTGFINEPVNYLAAMNLFLLSSYTEGTSMTLLEAMSLGIPAVVTDVGGNPEVVKDGVTGYLVPSNDDEMFANAIIRLGSDPSLAQKFSENSKKKFSQCFSVKTMTENYFKLYKLLH
jgi:glycosyltransferase involved in cell wall biosynthesis